MDDMRRLVRVERRNLFGGSILYLVGHLVVSGALHLALSSSSIMIGEVILRELPLLHGRHLQLDDVALAHEYERAADLEQTPVVMNRLMKCLR